MTRNRAGSRSWILLLGLASGLSAFGMASLMPALPALASGLQADFGTAQFVVSVYLLSLGLAQPFQGLLCDRFGRRPVVLVGFATFAAGSIAAAFAPTLPWLVAVRCVQAAGVSVGTVAARAMVRDTHEPERAAISLSFITAVTGLSPIVSPIAGGFIVETAGWRAVFGLHAAVALALLGWMFAAMPETRTGQLRAGSDATLMRASAMLLGDRRFLGYTFIYGCANGIIYAFLTVGAAFFGDAFRIGPARFGLMWALLAAAFAGGAWFAGTGARRWSSRRMLHVGVALTLLGATTFAVAALLVDTRVQTYLAALIFLLAGNGLMSPLALAGAVSGHPGLAGLASGLSSSIAMLTTVLFSAATGALYRGTADTIALLMALGAIGVAFSARVATRGPTGR